MTIELRRRVGDAYVVAEQHDDGVWRIEVTDALSNPIAGPEREKALQAVLAEISSLRQHIWKDELKRK